MIGIIFDCDGTLIDSELIHLASWDHALKKRGRSLNADEYIFLAGKAGKHISEELYKEGDTDSAEALFADKRKAYAEKQKQGIPLREHVVTFAKEIAANKKTLGIKLGLASAATRQEIMINLHHLGMKDSFDAIVSGEDDLKHIKDPEGANKPKPYIYLHAAKLLGVEPYLCAAIEDSETGVQAAVSAGMATFAIPNAFTKHHDFSKADYYIDATKPIDVQDFFRKMHALIAKKEKDHVQRKSH